MKDVIKKFKKSEQGAITILVLTALLFLFAMVSVMYFSISNKESKQNRDIAKIQEQYQEDDIDEIYYNEIKENHEESKTIEDAKNEGTVYEENTELEDRFGNIVKIPEGFKIADDSATDVTGGVVIEDVDHGKTAGSQFVWIPVGTVYTNEDKTASKTINLNRYTFDINTGKETAQGTNAINNYYQELATSTYGNKTAKEIEVFKAKASEGYYIGRYEARTANKRTTQTDDTGLGQITVKSNEYVYNYVTQAQASNLSRNMYDSSLTFASDLMNSYAWDTAIVFAQTFDNRTTSRAKPYSMQTSLDLNGYLADKGTNNLTDTTKQDKICNIWDMASNEYEWNTETFNSSTSPWVNRGGVYYHSENCTSSRNIVYTTSGNDDYSFRPIIYL